MRYNQIIMLISVVLSDLSDCPFANLVICEPFLIIYERIFNCFASEIHHPSFKRHIWD